LQDNIKDWIWTRALWINLINKDQIVLEND